MTTRQKQFVEEYLVTLNSTQAAIRAGYSPKTAEQQGYQLLHHPKVSEAIRDSQQERASRLEIHADWVIDRLKDEYEAASAACHRSAAIRALELLGKHLGLFSDKPREDPTESVEVVLKQIWQKQSA
jgi:phage terminase small subunit